MIQLRQAAEEHHESIVLEAGDDAEIVDDGADAEAAAGLMTPVQWITALIEVSNHCYPHLGSVHERLQACITALLSVVLPAIERVKKKREELNSDRVKAVFEYCEKDLRPIFRSYAAADQVAGLADASKLDTLNLNELTFMMKEAKLFDENLTILKLRSIFAEANQGAEEEGTDDDDNEMIYEEFLPALAMICDAKIPESWRGNEPFEYTLHAWLQLNFIPTYRKLLKEKARGTAKKTL